MRGRFVPFLCGLVFALGLGLSGMTDPGKIIGFLDVTGAWDPSLAFVMAGAVGVHFAFAQWARKGGGRKPLWEGGFHLATQTKIDAPLLVGAAIFGLGWGVAGYCPGPAAVAAAAGSGGAIVFLAAMLGGTAIYQWYPREARSS
jgi:hypothetical protein